MTIILLYKDAKPRQLEISCFKVNKLVDKFSS